MAGALPPARIPPEALRDAARQPAARRGADRFHGAARRGPAGVRFTPIDPLSLFDKEPPLEVTLVNAKSETKPTKAELLAQANLDGGGNTTERRRAKTPLPLPPKETPQKDLSVDAAAPQAPQEAHDRIADAASSGRGRRRDAAAARRASATECATANEMMQKTLEAMRLEAQLAKDMDAYQKLPKRRFIGANAEEYRFARYVEDWRAQGRARSATSTIPRRRVR